MKKLCACLLLSVLLLASCGKSAEPAAEAPAQDSPSAEPVQTEETAAPETEAQIESPEMYGILQSDFGGEEVCLISGDHVQYEYMIEELTGEVVNDAVFSRNLAVEELLNVKFNFVSAANWGESDPFYNMVRKDIAAGDRTYDIVNGLNCYTTPLLFEGNFRRMDNIETIDFSHPWWVPGVTLDGSDRVYFAFSDASLSLYKDLYVMFFNKTIIEDNSLDDPYELVNSGKWTIDAFVAMGSAASRDLNGDGVIKPENDQIGYVAKHAANRALMTSTDTSIIHRGVDNIPTADGISERLVNVYEKLKPFLSDPTLTEVTTEPDMILLSQSFIEGRVLFLTNCMIGVEGMRDMADDYGIIPLPKYDEAQDTYYSQIATSTSALYLPITAENVEMLGTVMEALGFYSSRDVVPVYYETALNVKYARDQQVQAMLALVRDNASTNLDFTYNTIFWTNDVINAAWSGDDVASWWAGKSKTVNKAIQRYSAIELPG